MLDILFESREHHAGRDGLGIKSAALSNGRLLEHAQVTCDSNAIKGFDIPH